MRLYLPLAVIGALFCTAAFAQGAPSERQQEVAQRGPMVMPFSLAATTHVFVKTPDGGVQRVVTKEVSEEQRGLIQQHLAEIAQRFAAGDFAGPEVLHGRAMPGLAQLKAADAGAIRFAYSPLPDGAQITYTSARPDLVQALHRWFDAQLSDHGQDAIDGNASSHHGHH